MSHNILTITMTVLAASLLAACSASLPSNFSLPVNFPATPAEQTTSAPKTTTSASAKINNSEKPGASNRKIPSVSNREKQCLVRAMYFESNRSSESGMLAVATVVMNRVASPQFANSVCAVVGAPNQFAKAILTRPMNEAKPLALANSVAERVLGGERHPKVRSAKFFHQAGLSFAYDNMTYVLEAGGNVFYIKG